MSQLTAAQAEGMDRYFRVLIVLCTKTGGRFVSVRSVSIESFLSGLRTGAANLDYGYNMPIVQSFRKYGEETHTVTVHSRWTTRREANLAKKELIEKTALNKPELNLNYNRPVKQMPVTDFRWLSEEEVAEKVKAKRAKARVAKTTEVVTTKAAA